MAEESRLRESDWIKRGCNQFDGKTPISKPMSFWTEQDVLQYILKFNIKISSVYGDIVTEKEYANGQMSFDTSMCKLCTTGVDRTGCMFCGYGLHLEKEPTRFQRMKISHPKLYDYVIGGGEFAENGMWQPSAKGLGFGFVFETLNGIYGKDFIKYK
jgi:3'-phosphoadenosine 5'-phosphosulfate sulfotransferase (PAPS reductase)/FAD synthetase